MRINQVVVIPEYDVKHMGRYQRNYSEHDIIDRYVSTLCEFLDHDNISFKLSTKNAVCDPNSLILFCRSGLSEERARRTNFSIISHIGSKSKKISDFAIETVSEWGKCYVDTQHITRGRQLDENPIEAFGSPDTMGIVIDPFILEGPNHDDYIKRLPKLGEMLALCVFEFMLSRQEQPQIMRINS